MPTPEELAAEIQALEKLKPTVRRYGASGDNHAAIDAEIEVLKGGLTESQIWTLFEDEENDPDAYLVNCALDAQRWLAGQADYEAPHLAWLPLAEAA